VQTDIKTRLNEGKLVLHADAWHYSVIVGYDDRPAEPYWIVLDSLLESKRASGSLRQVPMKALAFVDAPGAAGRNRLEVLSRLELDLRDQGRAAAVRVVPGSVTLEAGQPLRLVAQADAFPPVVYRWSKDGRVLAGQTGSTLELPAAAPVDAEIYEIEIILPFNGYVRRSAPVVVTVDGPAPSEGKEEKK
jgi:hypothetical protein